MTPHGQGTERDGEKDSREIKTVAACFGVTERRTTRTFWALLNMTPSRGNWGTTDLTTKNVCGGSIGATWLWHVVTLSRRVRSEQAGHDSCKLSNQRWSLLPHIDSCRVYNRRRLDGRYGSDASRRYRFRSRLWTRRAVLQHDHVRLCAGSTDKQWATQITFVSQHNCPFFNLLLFLRYPSIVLNSLHRRLLHAHIHL